MPRLVYHMFAARDRGRRAEQQDAVNSSFPELQKDLGVLCVLSDGMGGLAGGREASQIVVETMVSAFHRSSIGDTPEQILLRGVSLSQKAVRSLQGTSGESGATLVAALIREDRCSFLSVGDSRIYLFRNGGLIHLNRPQTKGARIDLMIGMGRMPEEARTDSNRAGLTGYIGMENLERVDRSSHSFPVIPGDRILLMSDGVFGSLSEEEIAAAAALPEEAVCNSLIWQTMQKGIEGQDNCSAALISCLPAAGWT